MPVTSAQRLLVGRSSGGASPEIVASQNGLIFTPQMMDADGVSTAPNAAAWRAFVAIDG
jgi:hypothetical protein